MKTLKTYTLLEEIFHAVTHGIGTLLAVAALVLLVVFASFYGNVWHVVSFSIYGSTLVILYLTSTLYHSFQNERVKAIFKILDHSAIYLLIAGTYTPFTLVPLRGALGWSMFGIVWGIALVGIILKAFFAKRFVILSTITYLVMGWLIVIAIKPLVLALPHNGIVWLVIGGLFYTFGSIFYVMKKIRYHHVVWHLFVLGGSICHFFSILLYVLPLRH